MDMETIKAALLLTSSGPANSSKSQIKIKQFEITPYECDPLHGTEIDIKHFNDQQMFKMNRKLVIQSSKRNNTLHSLKIIKQRFIQHFYNAVHTNFLFSGHCTEDGKAMCIQTKNFPNGQPLKLSKIYKWWVQATSGVEEKKHLWIYLDCCYAGKQAIQFRELVQMINPHECIHIYCSSGPNHLSIDEERYGGLLICRKWKSQNYLQQWQQPRLAAQFQAREPIYVSGNYYEGWKNFLPLTWKYSWQMI